MRMNKKGRISIKIIIGLIGFFIGMYIFLKAFNII